MFDLIPSLISTVGGMLSGSAQGAQDAAIARENTDKTIAAQKEQADLAYQRNVDMWNKSNAYNAPASQMERYKAAGLNPQLAVGGGNPGNAGGIPQYNAPSLSYNYKSPNTFGNISQAFGAFQDFRLKAAQIDNVKAQTNSTNLQAIGTGIQNAAMAKPTSLTHVGDKTMNYLEAMNLMKLQGMVNEVENLYPIRKKIMTGQADASEYMGRMNQQELQRRVLSNDWLKLGVTPGDNFFLRGGARLLNSDMTKTFSKWLQSNFGY